MLLDDLISKSTNKENQFKSFTEAELTHQFGKKIKSSFKNSPHKHIIAPVINYGSYGLNVDHPILLKFLKNEEKTINTLSAKVMKGKYNLSVEALKSNIPPSPICFDKTHKGEECSSCPFKELKMFKKIVVNGQNEINDPFPEFFWDKIETKKYLDIVTDYLKDWKKIVYFPSLLFTYDLDNQKLKRESGLYYQTNSNVCSSDKCTTLYNVFLQFTNLFSIWATYNYLKIHSTKAAISAIMSRNVSHNIGSHVLAKISSDKSYEGVEGGKESWINDIQFLTQYIQQRQDFIAQTATEWPEWTYPAWLMKDLMRWFLSQKHLLNYIVSAEKLGSHSYIKKNADDVRLHVFKSCAELWNKEISPNDLNDDESGVSYWKKQIVAICVAKTSTQRDKNCTSCNERSNPSNFILLFTSKNNTPNETSFAEDISLAIPGGITGYHAFYTILENTIRNGAKHSFTKLEKSKKSNETRGSAKDEEKLKIAFGSNMDIHMDVVIEFYEDKNSQDPKYKFRVYDNISFVIDNIADDASLPLHKTINNKFEQDIIEENGDLRKNNWGLGEMKISAGYLQCRTLEDLGMGKDKITDNNFIIRAGVSPLGTLAYEFHIPKPKEVGIVCCE